jgi:catechol 2,3-dioxygenase-like lactoylglutathione lyase family enzyme
MVGIEHVALECDSIEHAQMLYEDVFQCSLERSFELPSEFADQVFSVKKNVKAFVYKADNNIFEVFITNIKDVSNGFSHVCISVNNMTDFFSRCKKNDLNLYTVRKNEKQYVFLRDMIGNLFEVKEK